MTLPGGDRIKETSATSGTASFVLTGAVSGKFRAFPASLDGKPVRYVAEHITAAEAESGFGIYTHATKTLTRLYRYSPTPGGAAVSFSAGGLHVACTGVAADFLAHEDTVDPTPDDDIDAGFLRGMEWLNTATPSIFKCLDHAAGGAVWERTDGAGAVSSVNGQTGDVVLDATGIELQAFSPSNYSPAGPTIEEHFEGVDVALGAAGGGGVIEVDDATDYSVTSFKVGSDGANRNEHRRFTGNENHLIEFVAANLADGDYGRLIRGGTGTVTLVHNDIALNGGTADIGLKSKVDWVVHEGEVLIDGGTDEPVDMEGVIFEDAALRDTAGVVNAIGNQSGALSVDYALGHVVTVTLTGNATSLTISNQPGAGREGWITFVINHGTGPFTWAHPTGTKWTGGSPPTLSTGASQVSIVSYVFVGTDIYGFLGGPNFA